MDNVKLILELFDAVEQRDQERLLEYYHDEVVFRWPPSLPGYGGVHKGSHEVAAMSDAFDGVWTPVQPTMELRRLNPRVVAATQSQVIVQYHQQGRGGDGVVRGTDVVGIYTIEHGKVTALEMFYREPEVVQALVQGTTTPEHRPPPADT